MLSLKFVPSSQPPINFPGSKKDDHYYYNYSDNR